LVKGFALLSEMETRLAAQVGFAEESLCYGGRAADGADRENLDFKNATLVFNAQLVTGASLARRLRSYAIRLNPADVAGSRGQGARLKEARGPKPFIKTQVRPSETWTTAAVGGRGVISHQDGFSTFQMYRNSASLEVATSTPF
jgi:hypothetical protein